MRRATIGRVGARLPAWVRTAVERLGRTTHGVGFLPAAGPEPHSPKRRNDALLRSVLDNTLDGIISIDEQGTVTLFNRAAERLFGYAEHEVLGRNVRMLMPGPEQGKHDEYLKAYAATRTGNVIGNSREVSGLRRDGGTFPIAVAVTEFEFDQQRQFVGIVRDVSETKRLEAQLQQAQKLEAIGQLAGGVAHDFNNLLSVISASAELLAPMLAAENEDGASMLADVRSAAKRAAALTRQLLAFSRQQVLAPLVLDLNTVVIDIEKMLRRLIGEDVCLTVALNPGLALVKIDAGQIEQVILNLAVNARDAMPSGGQLTIETANVELDQNYAKTHAGVRPGRYVLLALSDQGSGMTPDVRARLFEPFFTTKGVGKGTGLGLAVVHGIVRQSGGCIEVYSELGVGTTFKIYLPVVEERASVRPGKPAEPVPCGSETVLLVEDDAAVRAVAARCLSQSGYKVIEASSGAEALRFITENEGTVDLLLTDVVMPDMSGRKLSECLVARQPGLRVLFFSGYTDDAVVRHGVLQADVAFLQKPFTPRSLANKVRETLDLCEPSAAKEARQG